MQQKVVNGLKIQFADMIDAKLYEVSKYMSLTEHVTDFFVVSVNQTLWDGFSEEEKGIIS